MANNTDYSPSEEGFLANGGRVVTITIIGKAGPEESKLDFNIMSKFVAANNGEIANEFANLVAQVEATGAQARPMPQKTWGGSGGFKGGGSSAPSVPAFCAVCAENKVSSNIQVRKWDSQYGLMYFYNCTKDKSHYGTWDESRQTYKDKGTKVGSVTTERLQQIADEQVAKNGKHDVLALNPVQGAGFTSPSPNPAPAPVAKGQPTVIPPTPATPPVQAQETPSVTGGNIESMAASLNGQTLPCSKCGQSATAKTGNGKNGKPYYAFFCSANDEHKDWSQSAQEFIQKYNARNAAAKAGIPTTPVGVTFGGNGNGKKPAPVQVVASTDVDDWFPEN
jgi:hypothetical protein